MIIYGYKNFLIHDGKVIYSTHANSKALTLEISSNTYHVVNDILPLPELVNNPNTDLQLKFSGGFFEISYGPYVCHFIASNFDFHKCTNIGLLNTISILENFYLRLESRDKTENKVMSINYGQEKVHKSYPGEYVDKFTHSGLAGNLLLTYDKDRPEKGI